MEESNLEFGMKFENTSNFVYKGKEYPFNLNCFIEFSQYLKRNYIQFQNQNQIPLIKEEDKESHDLSEDSINTFISCCQKNKIIINKDNAVQLNYLSKLYEVDLLYKATDNYILKHNKELILECFEFNHQDSELESKISQNLSDFIKNDRFVKLSIPVMHRILSQNQNINDNDKIEFLFKCLDEHGRSASVLFSDVKFDDDKTEYLHKLLNEYSDKFDFYYINCELLKHTYLNSNESIKNYIKLSENAKHLNEIIEEQKSENDFLKEQINLLQNQQKKLHEKIEIQNKQIQTINEQFKETFEKQQKQIIEIQYQLKNSNIQIQQLQSIQDQNSQQIKTTGEQNQKQIQELMNKVINKGNEYCHLNYLSITGKHEEFFHVKPKKDVNLPFLYLTKDNSICTFEYNSKGSKIIFKQDGNYLLLYKLNIVNSNKKLVNLLVKTTGNYTYSHYLWSNHTIHENENENEITLFGYVDYPYKANDYIYLTVNSDSEIKLRGGSSVFTSFIIIKLGEIFKS